MNVVLDIPVPAGLAILAFVWLVFLAVLIYTGLLFEPPSPWVDILSVISLVTGLAAAIYLLGYLMFVAAVLLG
jgi:hypothetical protein